MQLSEPRYSFQENYGSVSCKQNCPGDFVLISTINIERMKNSRK